MSNKELLQEWKEAKEDFKKNNEDWNLYFYILGLQKEIKERRLDIKGDYFI